MRNITVTFDDGSTHVYQNAPDDVTPESIQARAKQDFGKNVTALDGGRSPARTTGATGKWGAGATGNFEKPSGFYRGFVNDPISGLQQLGAETEIANLLAPTWAKNKKAELQQNELNYQQARGSEGVDWPRLGGNIVNPVNLGITALTKMPPGASLPMRMVAGGAGGSTMGAAAPVYGNASRGEQAAISGLGGVIGAPLTGGAARVVKPNVNPNLALLRKEGITPTIGQSFGPTAKGIEDKAMSLPLLGDAITASRRKGLDQFQTAAYNRALTPIGEKSSGVVGFPGMKEVHGKLTKAYDNLIPSLSFKPDTQFVNDSSQLRQLISNLEPQDQKIYDSVINRVVNRATQQGNMSGETFKSVESELGKEISKLAKDQNYGKQEVHDALKQYRELMREGLKRSNPDQAQRLSNINEGWANYAILRDAASGVQSAKNEGMFTPAQLASGVSRSAKRQGQAVGKGKLSEGRGLMQDLSNAGQQVLPSNYPDSGTAGRLAQSALLGGLTAGQVPFTATALAGLAGSSVPYVPGVRKGLDYLLNARPEVAGDIAELIKRYPGLLAPATPAFVNSLQSK